MPPISERQRRAMQAAAHGKSTLGIPKSVGADFAATDPGGSLPPSAPATPAKRASVAPQKQGLQALIKKGKKE